MFFINIFTYKEDEKIVIFAAQSALKIFGNDCEVNVIDDSLNPISDEYRDILIKNKINYRISSFNRRRNLNGKECCLGLVSEFIKSAGGRDGVTIKLDSDTLLLHREFFDSFANEENIGYMASHRPGSIFSGICYCIKNQFLERIYRNLEACEIDENIAPEDMVIGAIATVSIMPQNIYIIKAWSQEDTKSVSTAWNYMSPNHIKAYEIYYNGFSIVTFGNWMIYSGLTKQDRIEPMEGIFNLIK